MHGGLIGLRLMISSQDERFKFSFRRSLPGSAGGIGCPPASSAIGPYSYEKVLVDGGFITAPDMRYHFFVTDHLGNVRVVVNDAGVIEQVNQFYPYGESIELDPASANPAVETITENLYKWGGKEWDEEQGAYDFGARMYSSSDARWTTMDPLCEKYYSISPLYQAGFKMEQIIEKNGGLPVSILSSFGGGGVTTPTKKGTHTVIVTDSNLQQGMNCSDMVDL